MFIQYFKEPGKSKLTLNNIYLRFKDNFIEGAKHKLDTRWRNRVFFKSRVF